MRIVEPVVKKLTVRLNRCSTFILPPTFHLYSLNNQFPLLFHPIRFEKNYYVIVPVVLQAYKRITKIHRSSISLVSSPSSFFFFPLLPSYQDKKDKLGEAPLLIGLRSCNKKGRGRKGGKKINFAEGSINESLHLFILVRWKNNGNSSKFVHPMWTIQTSWVSRFARSNEIISCPDISRLKKKKEENESFREKTKKEISKE